ncbi:hypothetical protein V8B97DRAFT_1872806 [Scleroderma yunnanense]
MYPYEAQSHTFNKINRPGGVSRPVEPTPKTFRIRCNSAEGKVISRSVRQCQFCVTTAYAFTDHRSQGKTLPVVVVDIATLPTGGLTLFNVYMARSPKSGRETIR